MKINTAHRIPDDFEPMSSHFNKADELGLDLLYEVECFKLHYQDNGKKWNNWGLTLTRWLLRAAKFKKDRETMYANHKLAIANDKEQRAVDFYSGDFKY